MSKSSPHKKLFLYLENFLDSDYFINEIKEIRKKYNIPENGYDFNSEKTVDEYMLGGIFFFPKEVAKTPSGEWGHIEMFYADINNIFKNTSWHIPVSWTNVPLTSLVKDKILYGEKMNQEIENKYLQQLEESLKNENLIKVSDSFNKWPEICMMVNVNKKDREDIANSFIPEMKKYPVLIKISPYATQRDLQTYIKDNWKIIKEKQEISAPKTSTELGKNRERNNKSKALYKLIWENKDLPIMDLTAKVNKETSYTLGYSDVTKILSRERQRRRQV